MVQEVAHALAGGIVKNEFGVSVRDSTRSESPLFVLNFELETHRSSEFGDSPDTRLGHNKLVQHRVQVRVVDMLKSDRDIESSNRRNRGVGT